MTSRMSCDGVLMVMWPSEVSELLVVPADGFGHQPTSPNQEFRVGPSGHVGEAGRHRIFSQIAVEVLQIADFAETRLP